VYIEIVNANYIDRYCCASDYFNYLCRLNARICNQTLPAVMMSQWTICWRKSSYFYFWLSCL